MRFPGLLLLLVLAAPSLAPPGPARAADEPLWIVVFEEPPLAERPGRPGARARMRALEWRQEERRRGLEHGVGRGLSPRFVYRAATNGMAVPLSAEEAARVAGLPGVARVVPERLLRPQTDRGPAFVGAPALWGGSVPPAASLGEGVVVGVVDTGINMDHPSFSDAPVDGYAYENPLGDGVYLGWCDPASPEWDPAFACNAKLIGAWDFVDALGFEADGPEDSDDHGSHVASTAAGNFVDLDGDGVGDLSGVAPHAHLVAYDVCHTIPKTAESVCPLSAMLAAVDQAVLDGVDVLNVSISGGTAPWQEGDVDRALLAAAAAGVVTAASAGNDGPAAGSVQHVAPWVLSTAASSHDRDTVAVTLRDLAGGPGPLPPLVGASRVGSYGPAPIVYAGDFDNGDDEPAQCLQPFPPATWSAGEIVLCDRGLIARVEKCAYVAAGGAGGCILADVPGGDPVGEVADPHVVPAVHLDAEEGETLRAWLAEGSGHEGRLDDPLLVLDPTLGDLLETFSARGPLSGLDLLKPDLSAPGVGVFAAGSDASLGVPGLLWRLDSGTSMASPHVAGAAALLRALRPEWSAAELRSALLATASPGVLLADGETRADGFEVGMGRLQVERAARAWLLLPESDAAFLAADPDAGGDPRTLNLPGMVDGGCAGACTFERRVRSTLDAPMTWQLAAKTDVDGLSVVATPETLSLEAGETASFSVEARVTDPALVGAFQFATLSLEPDAPGGEATRLRLAVLPTDWVPAAVEPLQAWASARLRLRFDRPGRDKLRIVLGGWRPDPPVDPAGLELEIDVGGVALGGRLDRKGRLRAGDDRVKLVRRRDGSLTLKVTRRRGSFSALLADEGLVSEDNPKPGKPVEVVVEVRPEERAYALPVSLLYRSKAGKKGQAR